MSQRKIVFIISLALISVIAVGSLCILVVWQANHDQVRKEILQIGSRGQTPTSITTPTVGTPEFIFPTMTPISINTATQILVLTPNADTTTDSISTADPQLTPPPASIPIQPTLTIGPLIFDSWCVPWHTEATRAEVTQVIDGITIQVNIDGNLFYVRYIGLALPSDPTLSHILSAAAEKNHQLVAGKMVMLVMDKTDVDQEGLLPRYVIADGLFVNQALVEEGYVLASINPPDTNCAYQLDEAAARAQATQKGMWAPLATPTRPIIFHPTATQAVSGEMIITKIQPIGVGWEDPDEYVEFRNISDFPIQLQGWRLSDQKGRSYYFPKFTINPGNYCRVYTNAYLPEHCGLSVYSLSPIWNDLQDCGYLFDSSDNLIDEFCYGY